MADNLVASPAPSYIPAFGLRTLIGCLGVLLAVHVAGFNEHVTEIGLSDIQGGMGLSHDQGTWMTTWYEAFNIASMAFTPWFYMTFSLYRFTIFMTAIMGLLAFPAPFMPDMTSLGILRALQGLSAGCLPPILMTTMLKYLPLPYKILGIGGYAMSATFGPNLAGPLETMWFEHAGWKWLYWEIIPLCAIAIGMVAYGIPRDPINLNRFKTFNWLGLLLGFPSIVSLVVVLFQGDRLDWFRSPMITNLTFGGGFMFIMFLVNEFFHKAPFFRVQFWAQRNIVCGLLTLAAVLVLCAVLPDVTGTYLEEVQGYRELQIAPLSLIVALPQLIILPLIALICREQWFDCRWFLGLGMVCMTLSAYFGIFMTPDWVRENFYLIQTLQMFGEPLAVIPVLMYCTMSLSAADGPFISGMVNSMKGMANAVGAALFATLVRRREQYHSSMLLDHNGNNATALHGIGNPIATQLSTMTADHHQITNDVLSVFHRFIYEQALVLSLSDINYIMMWLAAAVVVMNLFLPTRIFPPKAPTSATPAH